MWDGLLQDQQHRTGTWSSDKLKYSIMYNKQSLFEWKKKFSFWNYTLDNDLN